MSKIERFHFAVWAARHFPQFTTAPSQYAAAVKAWAQYKDEQHLLAAIDLHNQGAKP